MLRQNNKRESTGGKSKEIFLVGERFIYSSINSKYGEYERKYNYLKAFRIEVFIENVLPNRLFIIAKIFIWIIIKLQSRPSVLNILLDYYTLRA